ncbi:MAG: ATP-binding protein [Aerococcus sp.]|nr:ATP-binding protein [Aerococcus sp.]
MTKETYILIGCPGVGKSTYTKQFPDVEVFSSDKTRFALFHTLEASVQTPAHHAQVFKVLQDDLVASEAPINVYDATNLDRRFREPLYQRLRGNHHHVTAVVFARPLETIKRQNRQREEETQVPNDIVYRFYCSFEPPRIGVDCDEIQVIGDFTSFAPEIGSAFNATLTEELPQDATEAERLEKMQAFLLAGEVISSDYSMKVAADPNPDKPLHYAGNVASYYYLAYLHEHQRISDVKALDNVEVLYQQTKRTTPALRDTPVPADELTAICDRLAALAKEG